METVAVFEVDFLGERIPVKARIQGVGNTVLFVHGWLHSSEIWSDVSESLSQEWRCVAVDLPRFGGTPPSQRISQTLKAYSEFIETLAKSFLPGEVPFALVADSLGALLALRVAKSGAIPIPRLMLSGCPVAGLPPKLGWVSKMGVLSGGLSLLRMLPDLLARPAVLAGSKLTFEQISAVDDRILRAVREADPSTAASLFTQLLQPHWDTVPEPGRTRVLVLRGSRDRIVREIPSKDLAQRLGADYIELPGTGHTSMLESPEEYAGALRVLLKAPPLSSPSTS